MFKDASGESIVLACILVGASIGLVGGGLFGAYRASYNGYISDDGWDYWRYILGYGVAGGALGALGGWAFSGTSAAASISWGLHKVTTTAGTTAYAIGSYFENWFYKAYNIVNQQIRWGGYRLDAIYQNYIYELKNYTWSKYRYLGTLIKSFTRQATNYLDFVGTYVDGVYIKGVTFYFSSKPPVEIIEALEGLGVVVKWMN